MESKIKQSSVAKRIRAIYGAIFLGISLFWIYANLVLHVCFVGGESMEPNFHNGDILKCNVDFESSDVKRGDVIVASSSVGTLIKRVIALPGESVYVKNGQIYVGNDGSFELSGYEFDAIEDAGILPTDENDALELSEAEFFCVGDNRNHSIDCRTIGPIKFNQIKRIVIKRMFVNIDLIM